MLLKLLISKWSFHEHWLCRWSDIGGSFSGYLYARQAKVLTGGAETCANRKSTSPCLLAIPAFDRIAGLSNRQLNSNRGICLRWRFWSQSEGLDWLCQRLGPRLPWTKYGRDKLWLAPVWVPSPDWLCLLEVCVVYPALRWSCRAWGRGLRVVPRLCIVYPGICLINEENHVICGGHLPLELAAPAKHGCPLHRKYS